MTIRSSLTQPPFVPFLNAVTHLPEAYFYQPAIYHHDRVAGKPLDVCTHISRNFSPDVSQGYLQVHCLTWQPTYSKRNSINQTVAFVNGHVFSFYFLLESSFKAHASPL